MSKLAAKFVLAKILKMQAAKTHGSTGTIEGGCKYANHLTSCAIAMRKHQYEYFVVFMDGAWELR